MILRRRSLWLAVIVLALAGILDIFYVYYFGTFVDEFFFATALRSTKEEVAEFYKTLPEVPLVVSAAWVLVCGIIGVLLNKTKDVVFKKFKILQWVWVPATMVWVLLIVLYGVGLRRFEILDSIKSIYPSHLVFAAISQRMISSEALYVPLIPDQVSPKRGIDIVVVVIGESSSAQRWSLLGYQRNGTNAALKGIQQLKVSQVLAQDFVTAGALPFVLMGRSVGDSIRDRAPSFLDIAKYNGYKVFVYNNSRALGKGDFFVHVLRRSASVYQKINSGGAYDEVLTPWLEGALKDDAPRKLIVLHTYGSHEIVKNRYPSKYAVFSDAYDNSIYYTSDLLSQWINLLDKKTNQSVLMLYTSDHGLVMPPCSDDYRHGRGLSSLEVPYVVWGNDAARSLKPELFSHEPNDYRSNAILAESVIDAVGYGQLLNNHGWPSSSDPSFEGHTWATLRRLDACTLR